MPGGATPCIRIPVTQPLVGQSSPSKDRFAGQIKNYRIQLRKRRYNTYKRHCWGSKTPHYSIRCFSLTEKTRIRIATEPPSAKRDTKFSSYMKDEPINLSSHPTPSSLPMLARLCTTGNGKLIHRCSHGMLCGTQRVSFS